MYEYKANYNDLISDFNLYLCERFVTETAVPLRTTPTAFVSLSM